MPPGLHHRRNHSQGSDAGVIIDLLVQGDDGVEQGQTLLILESMKMHNDFESPRKAVVKEVRVSVGTNLNQNETMLILE